MLRFYWVSFDRFKRVNLSRFKRVNLNRPYWVCLTVFSNFSNKYQQDKEIELSDNFTISDSAVKKQARAFKSIIKLDKNFHIYVHGNNQYIKRGYDEATGMHYYQLFFKEEL